MFVLHGKLTEEMREKWIQKIKDGMVNDLENVKIFISAEAALLESVQSDGPDSNLRSFVTQNPRIPSKAKAY